MTVNGAIDEQWDVVVVGSGPGGLTAGAALAAAGRRVLVLEAHDLAGGNTQVFRRHHTGDDGTVEEYEFDVGVHYIGDCGPGGLFPTIFAGLGVGDRMHFRPLDPDGFDTLHFPDLNFVVPAGWDRYRERLVEAFPNERAGIERVVGILDAVAQEGRARSIPGAQTPTFDRWAFRPLSELFDEGELSDRSAAVLDHWSGLYAGSPSQTAVAMHASIIDHYMRGAYYPEGGGQMIPARLIQVIEAFGGEVRTLTPVRRIIVEDRRATGVELADGTTIAAEVVISNADHARTVFDLVGEEHWDAATVRWTREAEMTLGLVCVYLVVDLDLCDGANTNHFVFPTYATDELYAELDRGNARRARPRPHRRERWVRWWRRRLRLPGHGLSQGPRQRAPVPARTDEPADHDPGAARPAVVGRRDLPGRWRPLPAQRDLPTSQGAADRGAVGRGAAGARR